MEAFLKQVVEWEKFELLIDTQIFPKNIILKAAYQFLDKGYFFFKLDEMWNIILQFTTKSDVNDSPETIIWDFSDELLSTLLRDNLEKDNKEIRESIVWTAIRNSLDIDNFRAIDTDKQWSNSDDFDKDIDEILKEIKNDPELKIDEKEIENILKEIEDETQSDEKKKIVVNPVAVEEVKKKFKN